MLIDGKKADEYQEAAIKSTKNTLLIAAAGSGKTFTILGKLQFLTTTLKIKPEEILLISFTNKSVNDLKNKIKINTDIYTFHKLAIDILKYNNISYKITNDNTLEYITNEFFLSLDDSILITKILKYHSFYDYQEFLKSKSYEKLKKIIITFIHLYKTNAKTIENIKNIYKKDTLLIELIVRIYALYQSELISSNSFDFDDLITEATKYVNNYKKYKYIIIDEFQDTSLIRWNLVNSLRKATQAILFVVGDDYQSIFKFSGCDVNIFLNFTTLVENSTILKLKYTYRNSQELINISSKFIMKNKKQITKSLLSHKHLSKPIIIKYYFNPKKALANTLDSLKNEDDILVLGRNNFDIKKFLPTGCSLTNEGFIYKNKVIKYMTVHSSKGLEANKVILINLENSLYGFPNQLINNKVIDELQTDDQEIVYAEERRLFYVALTRTKNEVFLLCPIMKKSSFVKEIKHLR